MSTVKTNPQDRRARPALTFGLAGLLVALAVTSAPAAVVSYVATLTGAAESPPNASPGTGFAQVDIDPVAHTMHVFTSFSGLSGTVTAAHIHGPTAAAGTGTAGVATTTPTFTAFPSGVTFGMYDRTFDTSLTSSFGSAFLANNGGTAAAAEGALFLAITDGKAYLNIHSNLYPGGEIRGFLVPLATADEPSSWGGVKSLYR